MNSDKFTTRTLRLRVKDKHAALLRSQAWAVNQVWNYVNELSLKHFQRQREFLSAYDMQPYTKGAGKELGLHSQTVQGIQEEYCTRRRQFKKVRLSWRKSSGVRRSLGWIPFKAAALRYKAGQVWYCGQAISLWDSYGLADYALGPGSFSEDASGRWYLNIVVKVEKPAPSKATASVGIDLGLKDFLSTSDGLKVDGHRFYRDLEAQLAIAQRANKKQRVKAIHAKIKARRKDALHKLSTELVCSYGAIFIGCDATCHSSTSRNRSEAEGCGQWLAALRPKGLRLRRVKLQTLIRSDVNAASLAKTSMAKSVLDAGWSAFRTMLSYKCDDAGVWFEEIKEAYSTQTCSCCGSITGPKGVAGLGIRGWRCSVCGTEHDRDVNAAKNILAAGRGCDSVFAAQYLAVGGPGAGELQATGLRPPLRYGCEMLSGASLRRSRLAGGILALPAPGAAAIG